MRISINGERYSAENEILADLAKSLGWEVDDSKLYHCGLMFHRGDFRIWKVREWRKCEYIAGMASNHVSFKTPQEALQSGFVADPTRGLGHHGLTVGSPVKWWDVEFVQEEGTPVKKRVELEFIGVAKYAFGEGGKFIVADHDGKEISVSAHYLR